MLAIPVVAAVGAWAYHTIESRGRQKVGYCLLTGQDLFPASSAPSDAGNAIRTRI